ncbi:DNA-3-methyladenine glycosylase family protein [Anaerocolumna sp. MB42-C2]|uniref:DNA-3-methyladenine glycosylase family protein n=1 Tax=Anaerocolumna sp. MB42-C2 TaxID=3070997 RepID=UPI0027E0F6B4|nr:DNA glycosylase [Anaerocolumna sp. MB42-C2]WMJ88114.1 DNA glycosylase [Anaerocolumna sp. MB42-C2]
MLIYSNNFNLKHIADSGQCFRMNPVEDAKYSLIAYDKYIELTQVKDNCIELSCSEEDYNQIWKHYFDLDFNYEQIVTGLSEGQDDFLKNAAKFGNGLRILKQDIYETLISFIISQRKNIPAIKNCIEILCVKYGKRKISRECGGKEYYTFPSPESLANASAQDLKITGLGYRDRYILKTSQSVLKGDIDLKALRQLSFEETLKQLQTLSGVGIKVANCVALYGLHHIEAFPIDVWIARILKDIYNDQFNLEPYNGFAGIVQQYMFYYIRNKK